MGERAWLVACWAIEISILGWLAWANAWWPFVWLGTVVVQGQVADWTKREAVKRERRRIARLIRAVPIRRTAFEMTPYQSGSEGVLVNFGNRIIANIAAIVDGDIERQSRDD